MEFSPLLKHKFEKINQTEDEEFQSEKIKAELFEFVTELRTSFLQSFYFLLDPEKMSTELLNSSINVILPRPEGFYFSSALSLHIPHLGEPDISKVHIKNSDYLDKFREIYHLVYWFDEKTPRLYQDTFGLFFYAEESIKEFLVSLQIENLYVADQADVPSYARLIESSEITTKSSRINIENENLYPKRKLSLQDVIPPDASHNESKTSQEENPTILTDNFSDKINSEKDLVIINKDISNQEDKSANADKIIQITLKLNPTPNKENKGSKEEVASILQGDLDKTKSTENFMDNVSQNGHVSENTSINVDKILQKSQLKTNIDQELYTLTIKRPLFNDEKDFKDFMLWHLAVACNDNKEGWLWKY